MFIEYFFDNIKNNIDFFLRNKIRISRKNYYEPNESKYKLFDSEEQKKQLSYLADKYDLDIFSNGSMRNYLENLYCLDVLDKYLSVHKKKKLSLLDIGSKSWNYVKSEYLFLNQCTKNASLTGIELDAYRMCTNLYTRFEIAKSNIKNLKNTEYIAGDFLEHKDKYDYIIWFLPFITEYPLVRWGLPLRYFKPAMMLEHAYNSLNDGGELLIVNQGLKEYNIQKNLCEQLNFNAEYYDRIDDIFNVFSQDRYCCKIVK